MATTPFASAANPVEPEVATFSSKRLATGSLTAEDILAAMREIPQQMASLKAGRWQKGVGLALRGRTRAAR